jgi:magnesium transporter
VRAHLVSEGAWVETDSCDRVRESQARSELLWLELKREDLALRELLRDAFKIHPLVVEDIWNDSQLPKVSDFDDFVQIIAHSIHPSSTPERVVLSELDIILGRRFIVTRVHGDSVLTLDGSRSRKLLEKGPAWIAHALLNHVVDDYVPLLDTIDQRIAELETEVIKKGESPSGKGLVNRILILKRSLQTIRRVSIHQRELLLRLSRGEFEEIPAESIPFFRDVYDHFVRVTDLAEGHRETLAALLDAFWSVQSHRMNEVMKTLTLISTIMMPLTFIAGVYGMNFDVMPELKLRYGYPVVLATMAAVALSIYVWFRTKRWI